MSIVPDTIYKIHLFRWVNDQRHSPCHLQWSSIIVRLKYNTHLLLRYLPMLGPLLSTWHISHWHPAMIQQQLSPIEPISCIMWQTFGFGNTKLPPKAILKGSKCKPRVTCKIKGTCLWDRGLEDIYNTVHPYPSTVFSRALQTWLCVMQDTQ